MEQRPKIGLSGLVLARVISDDENGIVYDTPFKIPGAVVATINPNSSVETDYADDGAFFAQNNRGNTELSLEMIDITPESEALMLGQKRVNGVTIETDLDQSPYFAFGGRILRAGSDENGDAVYEYIWYAKGKFSVPESGGETKRDSLTFGHKNLTAQFVKTQFVPDGQKSGTIGAKCRTDDPEVPASLIENWFNAPVISVAQNTGAFTVTASGGSNNTVILTGSKEGGANVSFGRASAKLGETIIVTDASGELVDGTIAFGGTATAPTITFTPAEDANAPAGVTVTSGLKDNYGIGATPMTDIDL
jgi:phi13 family phage major tail protein